MFFFLKDWTCIWWITGNFELACPIWFTTTTVNAIQQMVAIHIRYHNKCTHSYKMEKIHDKFSWFCTFIGQTVQSNNIFTISNCLLGLESKSKPATKPSGRWWSLNQEYSEEGRPLLCSHYRLSECGQDKPSFKRSAIQQSNQRYSMAVENKVHRCSAKYWPGAYDTDYCCFWNRWQSHFGMCA